MLKRIILCFVVLSLIAFVWYSFVHTGSVSVSQKSIKLTKEYPNFIVWGEDGVQKGQQIRFSRAYITLPHGGHYAQFDPSITFDHKEKYIEHETDENKIILINYGMFIPRSSSGTDIEVRNVEYDMVKQTFSFGKITPKKVDVNFYGEAFLKKLTLDEQGLHFKGKIIIKTSFLRELENEEVQLNQFFVPFEGPIEISAKNDFEEVNFDDTFVLRFKTLHFRYERKIESIYITDGSIRYNDELTNFFTAEEYPINIIEIGNIGDAGYIIKIDSGLTTNDSKLMGMESYLLPEIRYFSGLYFFGKVKLPETMPDELSRYPLQINQLHFRGFGPIKFEAYPENFTPINIKGWNFEFSYFNISEDEITARAHIQFPRGEFELISPNFAGSFFSAGSFILDWQGQFIKFSFDPLSQLDFELENGIKVVSEGIMILVENSEWDGIMYFNNPIFILPSSMGGETISVDGLGMDAEGNLVWPEELMKYKSRAISH